MWDYLNYRDIKSQTDAKRSKTSKLRFLTEFVEGKAYFEVDKALPIPTYKSTWQKLNDNFLKEMSVHSKYAIKQIHRDYKRIGLDKIIPYKWRPLSFLIIVFVLLLVSCYCCCRQRRSGKQVAEIETSKKIFNEKTQAGNAGREKREKLE